ncbi:hypothetical protein FMUAM8_19750 [Nocardia cyriacigeorgica]|nr:hypothetical protein FMUAM8_19750 [Nocardia cyriacigeorgica]
MLVVPGAALVRAAVAAAVQGVVHLLHRVGRCFVRRQKSEQSTHGVGNLFPAVGAAPIRVARGGGFPGENLVTEYAPLDG